MAIRFTHLFDHMFPLRSKGWLPPLPWERAGRPVPDRTNSNWRMPMRARCGGEGRTSPSEYISDNGLPDRTVNGRHGKMCECDSHLWGGEAPRGVARSAGRGSFLRVKSKGRWYNSTKLNLCEQDVRAEDAGSPSASGVRMTSPIFHDITGMEELTALGRYSKVLVTRPSGPGPYLLSPGVPAVQ